MRSPLGAVLLAASWLAPPAPALANGALPATIQVLLPPGAPGTIIVATNFGLISSTDDGGTWQWICEHDLGTQGKVYQLAAPPGVGVFGLATDGLITSGDLGCGWSLVMDQQAAAPLDYFPDPTDPRRALALGLLRGPERIFALLELTLSPTGLADQRVLYRAPAGEELSTLELARSNPRVLYTTLITPSGTAPARLARSDDAGATWVVVAPQPPEIDLGILAIANPDKLYLRAITGDGDKLVVSEDGGKTLRQALAPKQVMTAFAQLSNGHVIAAWSDIDRGYLYRSTDGAATFALLPTLLHPRALAQRAGRLYLATDVNVDQEALAVSGDEGQTWKRAMGLEDVVIAKDCAAAAGPCAAWCQVLVGRKVFPPSVCGVPAPPADAAAGAGVDVGAPKPPEGGCSCRLGGAGQGGGLLDGLPYLAAVLAALLRARERR